MRFGYRRKGGASIPWLLPRQGSRRVQDPFRVEHVFAQMEMVMGGKLPAVLVSQGASLVVFAESSV